ncbi:hypothetical protein FRB98_006834 [Tulasnella sp. 332]|nr:hypothetical protein FRB98_006834 [Tulasnella sp. 332]
MATREIFYARPKRQRSDETATFGVASTESNLQPFTHPQSTTSYHSSFLDLPYPRLYQPIASNSDLFGGRHVLNLSSYLPSPSYPSIGSTFSGASIPNWSTATAYPESSDRTTRPLIEPSKRQQLDLYSHPIPTTPKTESEPRPPVVVEISPRRSPRTLPDSENGVATSVTKPRQQRRETLGPIKHLVFSFRVESPDGSGESRNSPASKARRVSRYLTPTMDPPMICKFQAMVAFEDEKQESSSYSDSFVPEVSLSPTFPYQTLRGDDGPLARDGVRWLVGPPKGSEVMDGKNRTLVTGAPPAIRRHSLRPFVKSDPVLLEDARTSQPSTWASGLMPPGPEATSDTWGLSSSSSSSHRPLHSDTYSLDLSFPARNSQPMARILPNAVFDNSLPEYGYSHVSSSSTSSSAVGRLPGLPSANRWMPGNISSNASRPSTSRFGGLFDPSDFLVSGRLTQVLEASISAPPPREHICQICKKGFERPSSLHTHMTVHSGEKPYECTVQTCRRQFSVRSNLRRHLRKHGIDPRTGSCINTTPSLNSNGQRRSARRVQVSKRGVADHDSDASYEDEDYSSDGSPGQDGRGGGVANPAFNLGKIRSSMLPWIPESLKMMMNAATLSSKPPFNMTWCTTTVSVPLRPVRPWGSPSTDQAYEERNSYDPYIPESPYHPTQVCTRKSLWLPSHSRLVLSSGPIVRFYLGRGQLEN